ncbi:MAG: chlorophyll synthesis pathway protein BchC [Gemmatimonadetes bacterium]|nr:chlorophyll synthesis pathway protein BchC [Gemmatimonadota bacterium]MCB9505099.1 chlorophyll synthesis pathway protein BchC [Gemmatimonadales bacterium]MCB9517802.1 chlorophyll synthesis pathway protein BchC [Gemmatimonadales bacterium]HPF60575.1 chlorophyll synthesis pathway protein BchC [Gemmatimonadales bacterium]HRX18869.1 chlorophyll synthesis pathway protein BchC [Gemmatimonadales bacterium]
MNTLAVVLEQPEQLALRHFVLPAAGPGDVVVDVDWTGISAGTERLLWTGRMPAFPGMGYPLVPGYETCGRIIAAGEASGHTVGEHVFLAGARCYGETRALFGGAASRIVVDGSRATAVRPGLGADATLFALTATAYHAAWGSGGAAPELIIGHGALGRLLARLACALAPDAPPPVVWETNPRRRGGARGYQVLDPAEDPRRDYRTICDMSGATGIVDDLVARLAPGGEIVLAGFYAEPVAFAFPPAFQREARLRVAAEWRPADLAAVAQLVNAGTLDLGGLVSHQVPAASAAAAYRTAFEDTDCIKMTLDWRDAG